ncbi:MAG TPA: hypothetical protein PLR86_09660, partial [Planctomycetota bacterium]|nr:hypothetical protein [Planctomycetota bacterium]
LEQRLQQTPWDATLYKDSTLLLTEMAKMHFENHETEKAKEYQKKAEKKLRTYFSIQPYNRKIFTQFAESYIYILDSNTIKEDLYVSQEFFNVSILSLEIFGLSNLFPYLDICRTYLQKEKSTWNKDKFNLYKESFQKKTHNILLQNILTPLVLSPEFCKLYQEDKEIRELFQQEREQAIQNHDIQKPIKQLLAYYYLTRDTEYLSYIFTYTNKYIPTLHHILNQDEEYFFRFLAAYVLSICKEEQGKDEQGKDEQGKDEQGKDEQGKDEQGKDEQGKDEQGKDEQGKDEQGKDEQGKDEQGKDEQIKDAKDALEKTMRNWVDNIDSALLSYICAKKIDLQIEYPDFLYDIPSNITDTTKLIFLQYLLSMSNKDKAEDIIYKYVPQYLQDENPNIVLLAMYCILRTMVPKDAKEIQISTPDQKKGYAKTIQQIWEIVKTQEEKHILLFLSISNKFSNFIKLNDAMEKNIITDIYHILNKTQNPDIQENALKFLQHYSEYEYENIAKTWLQKDHLEESIQLFLISSIENNLDALMNILLNKKISLFSKIFLLKSMIESKAKSILAESEQYKNIEFIIKIINDIVNYTKMIKKLIWHQNIDNKSKPFYVYLLIVLPNIPPVYDIKTELLYSENEEDQKPILLSLGSYPFLGYYNKPLSYMKIKKKPRKVKKEESKKNQEETNNKAMFQEDIQNKLKIVSKTVQPYVAYAYVMMESYLEIDQLPKPECFTTKEQKWGALYGYEKILY